MITAVDTNVLMVVFQRSETHYWQSRQWLQTAHDNGDILVCEIVYAELASSFGSRSALDDALRSIHATVSPIDADIAYEAGVRWVRYRRAGGPRSRILTDFLIGAHALARADALLTRDRGFFTYFPELGGVGC